MNLPQPTTDISQMRSDIKQWGYCMIQGTYALTAHSNQPAGRNAQAQESEMTVGSSPFMF